MMPNRPFSYDEQILLLDDFPNVTKLVTDKRDPDEAFFIRTHRAFEIWFAEILDELEYARSLLAQPVVHEDDVPKITHHIRRAAVVLDLLRHHLPVLETLQTASFYDFRLQLFGASGGDSYRFRAIEWLIGFLDEDLWAYATDRVQDSRFGDAGMSESLQGYRKRHLENGQLRLPPEERLAIRHKAEPYWRNAVEHQLNVRSALGYWLQRTPFVGKEGDVGTEYCDYFRSSFTTAYVAAFLKDANRSRELGLGGTDTDEEAARAEASRRVAWFLADARRAAIVFILQFAEQPLLAWPAAMLEAVLDLDEALANWRDRHIQMVARVLGGGRVSTMGAKNSGLHYLRPTTSKRAFPEIWDARSLFLGRAEARDIYPHGEERWPQAFHSLRLAYEMM